MSKRDEYIATLAAGTRDKPTPADPDILRLCDRYDEMRSGLPKQATIDTELQKRSVRLRQKIDDDKGQSKPGFEHKYEKWEQAIDECRRLLLIHSGNFAQAVQ